MFPAPQTLAQFRRLVPALPRGGVFRANRRRDARGHDRRFPGANRCLLSGRNAGGEGAKIYDGGATSDDVGTLTYDPAGYDPSFIFGAPICRASGTGIGIYGGAGLSLGGLYSNQFGYEISFVPGTLMVGSASDGSSSAALERNRLTAVMTQGTASIACER